MSSLFSAPVCRDMQVLDRNRFKKTVKLAAAQVAPKVIPLFRSACSRDILKQPRLRAIYDRNGQKLVALRPEISVDDLSELDPESSRFIEKEQIEIVPMTIDLTYEYWQADDILAAIFPESLVADSPAGFTMVGHIAHMNLRDQYLPYKNLIGQVILDKNSAIRTVVNKLDTIDSVYRNFQMEVLAGESDLIAEQHESGCKFRFDFSKVYWNSRLHTEHERLVSMFKEGEAVCDVMAGVGPFAIPAAKKKVLVFANDLNPASYDALLENIELNNVGDFVVPANVDGREFIRSAVSRLQKKQVEQGHITIRPKNPPRKRAKANNDSQSPGVKTIDIPGVFQHYVMNLPASAIEFLDAFRGLYSGLAAGLKLPKVHVHCFTKYEEAEARQDLTRRISDALGFIIQEEAIDFHHVRRVAPSKDMFCCSFILPRDVAFSRSDS